MSNIVWYSMIYDEGLVPFAIGSAVTSLLVLFVDYLYFYVHQNKESILGITYRGNNILIIAVTWFGGGFIVPYLCVMFEIFGNSTQAMISLGILWPIAFTKLVDSSKATLGGTDGSDGSEEDLPTEED
ncbi:MAG: hypothetical protein ACI935_000091 [Moritella dasanensis]|jgi:hypothetical protein